MADERDAKYWCEQAVNARAQVAALTERAEKAERERDEATRKLKTSDEASDGATRAWWTKHTEAVQLLRRLVAGDNGAHSEARAYISDFDDYMRLFKQ
jgi:hypothetical protein